MVLPLDVAGDVGSLGLHREEREAREPAGPERREPRLVAIGQTRDRHVLEVHAVRPRQPARRPGQFLEARPAVEGITST
jgi:hypothetical protein